MIKLYSCLLALTFFGSVTYAQTIKPEFPFTDREVRAIIKYGNTIYIAGRFSNVLYPSGASYPRHLVAAFDATTGAILPWEPHLDAGYTFVEELAAGNNVIYISGFFGRIGGVIRPTLASVDPVTGAVTSWNPELVFDGSNIDISKIVPTESRLYLAGGFRNNTGGTEDIIVLDPVSGQRFRSFSRLSDAPTMSVVLKDEKLFIGGPFSTIGSSSRPALALLNATDGSIMPWSPAWSVPNTFSNYVTTLAIKDNTLYAGGPFTGFGYDPVTNTFALQRNGVAAFDATTGAVLPWNPNVNGFVSTIKLDGNNVYIGGSFSTVGSSPRNNIAVVDAVSGAVSPWNPNANSSVADILIDGSTVFVGGAFTSIAGQSRPYFAALTAPPSAPVISCPSNITISNARNACSRSVPFAATATGSPTPAISYSIGNQTITSPYNFPVGTTTVTATAVNSAGSSSCTFTVTVKDTQPPAINYLFAFPNQLWPPNHKMRDVLVIYVPTDNCPGRVHSSISVSSNEPQGQENDWKIINDHYIQLRAERSGNNERIYTITVTATDQYGNTSSKSTKVAVPHDRSSEGINVRSAEKFSVSEEVLVKVQSNPSPNYFTVITRSGLGNQKVNLRLYDISGRLLEVKNVSAGETIQLGTTLTPGVYVLEYNQGNTIKKLKLVKQ